MVQELKAKPEKKPAESHKPWRVEVDTSWPSATQINETRYFWTERGAQRFAQKFLEKWGGGSRLGWTTRVFLLHKTEPPGARPLQVNTGSTKTKPARRD